MTASAPPEPQTAGRPPVWAEVLAPMVGTRDWHDFEMGAQYARHLKWRFTSGLSKLPAGTHVDDWDFQVRYVDDDGEPTSARRAEGSVLWVRYVGDLRRRPRRKT
jgi:hypothetical protein